MKDVTSEGLKKEIEEEYFISKKDLKNYFNNEKILDKDKVKEYYET